MFGIKGVYGTLDTYDEFVFDTFFRKMRNIVIQTLLV